MSASKPFPARFDSTCDSCGFDIEEGEDIRLDDGVPIHANGDCDSDACDEEDEIQQKFGTFLNGFS